MEAHAANKVIGCGILVSSGTVRTVVMKFLLEQSERGTSQQFHKFEKPWFMTGMMFVCQSLSIFGYFGMICFQSSKKKPVSKTSLVASAYEEQSEENQPSKTQWKLWLLCLVPSTCDLISTAVGFNGMIRISASAWQMAASSLSLFLLLFMRFVLKRPTYPFMWIGASVCCFGLMICGLAQVDLSDVYEPDTCERKPIYYAYVNAVAGMALVLVSQAFRMPELLCDEWLINDIGMSVLLTNGIQGLWGAAATIGIGWPVAQYVTALEGTAAHEDFSDTIVMINSSRTIFWLIVVYLIATFVHNLAWLWLIQIDGVVFAVIIDQLTTAIVWIANLVIYRVLVGTDYGDQHSTVGENWTVWSYMQLAGFVLVVAGILIHQGILRLRGQDYASEVLEYHTSGLSRPVP